MGEMKEERKRGKKIKQPKQNKTQTSVAKNETVFRRVSVLDSPEPAWAFVFHGGMAPFKDAALINITLNNQIISDRRKVPANGA